MTHTTYTFRLNDREYSAAGKNRFEAQDSIELKYQISLSGAIYKEIYKLKVVRTGKVK